MTDEEHKTVQSVDKDEVLVFQTNCSRCNLPTETRMKLVGILNVFILTNLCIYLDFDSDIPHFKQVVIMATSCSYCGYRSNEVKSGTGVSKTGTRIKLRLMHMCDLSRDVLVVIAINFCICCMLLHVCCMSVDILHSSVIVSTLSLLKKGISNCVPAWIHS